MQPDTPTFSPFFKKKLFYFIVKFQFKKKNCFILLLNLKFFFKNCFILLLNLKNFFKNCFILLLNLNFFFKKRERSGGAEFAVKVKRGRGRGGNE